MTRKKFLKMCSILGIVPFMSSISSCDKTPKDFSGKVIIVGAGAAGLSAGYRLQQLGVDFEILEASSTYGGRTKTNTDFADFPIPLGAEWVHVNTSIFSEIVNDNSVSINVNTTLYDRNTDYALYNGQQLSLADIGITEDSKFINSSWFDFFDQYIVPSISSKIKYNKVVQSINYTGAQVLVDTASEQYVADKVIIAVPVKILQLGHISFTPALPNDKQNAINNVSVWDGFKAFIEFSTKFYPAFTAFDVVPETAGQKLYYDAAYGQNSTKHIMGLFSVGTAAQTYAALSNDAFKDYMLSELDAVYNGQASANYVQHITQNWNSEPYIKGAYVVDHEDWRRVVKLAETVDDKVYFAGDGYGFDEDWSSVHVAARSAIRAVGEFMG